MGKTSTRSDAHARAEIKDAKKVLFYARIGATAASLGAQKTIGKKKKLRSRQKKLKAYDLTSLKEFLPDPNKDSKQPTADSEFKLNSKSRQKLVLKEGAQLKTVLNHSAFKSDPLGSIHKHLQSTQPPTVEKPVKKHRRSGKKKAKGKKSKASTGPRSMDI